MKARCVACHQKDDLANLVATYDWIHPGECDEWWRRRRSLPPPVVSFFGRLLADRSMKAGALIFVVWALVSIFRG